MNANPSPGLCHKKARDIRYDSCRTAILSRLMTVTIGGYTRSLSEISSGYDLITVGQETALLSLGFHDHMLVPEVSG